MHHHIYIHIHLDYFLYFLTNSVRGHTLYFCVSPGHIHLWTAWWYFVSYIDNILKYLMYDVSYVYDIFTKTSLLNRLANLVKTMLKYIYDHYI